VHFKGMLSLGAAFIAAVALVSTSGAGTASSKGVARIDVSTRASIVHYLQSIHVNPRGVVIQRGARNYAGPKCPGKGWTCTSTAHPVVQVASAGGRNTFQCAAAHCEVVQAAQATAAANTATCVRTTGITQSCSINQVSSSGRNDAIVFMSVVKLTGLTQDASQTASIVQQANGAADPNNPPNNRACVTQYMRLDTATVAPRGTPVVANLDGHQTLTLKQDSRYGDNNATESANGSSGGTCAPFVDPDGVSHPNINQLQTIKQTATGSASIEQYENTHSQGPNLSLHINQNKNGGGLGPNNTNNAVFSQENTLTAIARTPNGPVIQAQGTANGGLLADVNQFAHGHSNADAHQSEIQCEHATANGQLNCSTGGTVQYSQTQHGPVRKSPGDSSQTGNENCTPTCDSFMVTQGSTQDNDTHSGQTNFISGGFHTDGTGTVTQTATIDGQTSTDTQAGSGDVSGTLTCGGTSCTSTPPPAPTIDSGPPNPSTSSSATFAFSDVDSSATFLCQLDGGGYVSCTSPKTYTALDPGSHTFSVEAKNPTTGAISNPTSYTWTISSGNASVLIAGAGDLGPNSEPNNNLAQALTAAGYSVTQSTTLPADISGFGQVWWVDATPPTSTEQNQLIAFAQSGKGVYLTGERPCCEDLNDADQSIVDAVVIGGNSITVGHQGDVCFCNDPLPVNPNVVGHLATTPHTVTSWTPDAPGGMAGVPDSSVFSYYQPAPSTKQVVAAAWNRASTSGHGRLVVFMDINWLEAASSAANWSDVAENVAFFLSGLASPPTPPVILAPDAMVPAEPAHFAAPAQATPSTASGSARSTR
jgi:hypothetical protein